MRLFRRTEFDGLVAVTSKDLASSGASYLLSWKEDALRKRQDNESTTDIPALPTSLASIPVSATSLVPDLPNQAAAPSAAATSDGSGLLGLSSLGLLPTASAEAAAASTSSPSAAPSSSAAAGSGLLGVGVGTSVGLGGTSTPAAAPSTSIAAAATSVAPETSIAAPTSVVPVASSQPATSVEPAPASSVLPATSATPDVTVPTTASQAAPTSVAPIESTTAVPVVQSSSAIVPAQQSTSAAAIIPAKSSAPATTSVQVSSQVSSVANGPQVSSVIHSSTGPSKQATLTQTDASSTFAISTISPSAAADLGDPTLASSMVTRITKTGSVPGVTTETTGSGIIVTETLKPSNGMSAGTMAGVIVGAAAGGLIIAALILFMVRKGMRIRRMAKAESPPPSPLLNAYNPPLSPAPPLRIEVGMHQRMRSNDSDFWVSGKGSSVNEKEVDGHGYPMPISPLPSLREGLEMDGGMGRSNSGRAKGGFKFFPNMDQNGDGKEVVARNF